jgi:hypothetical protein
LFQFAVGRRSHGIGQPVMTTRTAIVAVIVTMFFPTAASASRQPRPIVDCPAGALYRVMNTSTLDPDQPGWTAGHVYAGSGCYVIRWFNWKTRKYDLATFTGSLAPWALGGAHSLVNHVRLYDVRFVAVPCTVRHSSP